MRTFKPNDRLANGATVIAFRNSGYKNIVLADWHSPHHRYVTWRIDDEGNTFLGHYFDDLRDAYVDFDTR